MLFNKGAKVNVGNNDGNTPLHFAMRHEKQGCIDLLIELGARKNIENKFGETPLQYAKPLDEPKKDSAERF